MSLTHTTNVLSGLKQARQHPSYSLTRKSEHGMTTGALFVSSNNKPENTHENPKTNLLWRHLRAKFLRPAQNHGSIHGKMLGLVPR